MTQQLDYDYSVMFSLSCVARCFALAGGPDAESELLARQIPAELAAVSYYAMFKICPAGDLNSGGTNRTFNDSIIMCAV